MQLLRFVRPGRDMCVSQLLGFARRGDEGSTDKMARFLVCGLLVLVGCPAGGPGGTGGGFGTPDGSPNGGVDADTGDPGGGDSGVGDDSDAGDGQGTDGGEGPGTDGGEGTDAGSQTEAVCNDGIDNDSDGVVDENCACTPGEMQPCFRGEASAAGRGLCRQGIQRCVTTSSEFGAWDVCEGDALPTDEVCSTGADEDCDGQVDEGCECFTGEERPCYPFAGGTPGTGICQNGRERCVDSMWRECDGAVGPGTEMCDGANDEDCDGEIDEGCDCTLGSSRACYGAATGRGVGACRDGVQQCEGSGAGSSWGSCSGAVLPRAEICSGGQDEDCDGLTDCADSDCTAACCEPWNGTAPIVPADAEVLFVVDRSGSMKWPAQGTTNSRWQELRTAMDQVLPSMNGLDTGLLTFPTQDGSGEGGNCSVSLFPDVSVGSNNGLAIALRLAAATPRGGDTPTPSAINTASTWFALSPSSRTRFVILATDGLPEPNCGATVSATVNAITSLRSLHDVDTFVLGIVGPDNNGSSAGIPALQAALNEFADAGGRPRAGTLRYYEAVDGATIADAMRSILAAASDCSVQLSSAPPGGVSLTVQQIPAGGGAPITIPTTQFSVSGSTVQFTGAACTSIRAGNVDSVQASHSC